jgi:uncharacterized protein (TIGR04562 family)
MLQSLKFDWSSIKVALEGQSAVDIPRLNIKNKTDAKQFLFSYGYDVDDPLIREEIWRIYFQAIAFIREQLLDPGEKIPDPFLMRGASSDIIRLLIEASEPSKALLIGSGTQKLSGPMQKARMGRWACAILRVMHIISHLDNDVRVENFQAAREQIFGRFDRFITQTAPRRWRFGDNSNGVGLVRYIKKERKERNSILIKLLSKPQAVIEEIYDRLGFRFVTETRFDCYRLLQVMLDFGVIVLPNIQPGRSVNSLIPLDIFKEITTQTHDELEKGQLSLRLARRKIQKLEEENLVPLGMVRNPLSSRWYRAIQFTCRHLIVAQDPTFKFWMEAKARLEKSAATRKIVEKIPVSLREKKTFFYPFEVQILDVESYVESIGGRSRHRDYKQKQRLMARNRVLRDLV